MFGITPLEVNSNNAVEHSVGNRPDHMWTHFFGSRSELLSLIELEPESLVVPHAREQVVMDALPRIVHNLDTLYENGTYNMRSNFVNSAFTYYSYRSFLSGPLNHIHPENYESYINNELNHCIYDSIERSRLFNDRRLDANQPFFSRPYGANCCQLV